MVNNIFLDFCNGQRGRARAWARGGRHDPDLHRLPHGVHLRQHQQEGRTRGRCSRRGLSLRIRTLSHPTHYLCLFARWEDRSSQLLSVCGRRLPWCVPQTSFLSPYLCIHIPTHYLALYSANITIIQIYRIVTFWGGEGQNKQKNYDTCILMEYIICNGCATGFYVDIYNLERLSVQFLSSHLEPWGISPLYIAPVLPAVWMSTWL